MECTIVQNRNPDPSNTGYTAEASFKGHRGVVKDVNPYTNGALVLLDSDNSKVWIDSLCLEPR